jgi:DHA2 family multidrug resistance protein
MMDRGPTQDWFSSKEIWTEAIIAMIAFWVFLVQTLTAEHPFFHRDIAKDRNFVTCTFFSVFNSGMLFSTSALLPTLMQNLLGYSAMQSGMVSMARGVGSFVGFAGVPFIISRLPPRLVLTTGLCLSILGLWQMSKFDLSMTAAPIISAGIVQGIGMSMVFAPLNVFSWATLDPAHRTEATVVSTMIRSLGSSIGISGMQAALVGGQALAHARLADKIVIGDPVVTAALPTILDPATQTGLMALNGDVTRQAAMISYDSVFAWMALIALCVFPLLFLMRPPPPEASVELTSESAPAE